MTKYYTPSGPKLAIYGVILLGAFLLMAYFVRGMLQDFPRRPVNQARAEQRLEGRDKLAAASAEALTQPGWADEARGLVRLPIARAMEMVVQIYQDPEAGRAILMERAEKAAAPLPAAPEQPSEFE